MNHDSKRCEENVFRGENTCKGYYYMSLLGSSWGKERRSYFACPCKCHAGITEKESLDLALKDDSARP